jgi:hypothetical protein
MTVEKRLFVKLPSLAAENVIEISRKASAALSRAEKAPIGDRVDIVRFERAQAEIELLAILSANENAPSILEATPASNQFRSCVVDSTTFPDDVSDSTAEQLRRWIAEDAVVVECVAPFHSGETQLPPGTGGVRPAAKAWQSRSGKSGLDAVRERFVAQLLAATRKLEDPVPISPSGVANRVLTDSLWTYAKQTPKSVPVLAPITYRDGSKARPFPLRGLDLVDDKEPTARVRTFSLLSIRHVELDAEVDGAWLRNTEISQRRPAGDTDELAYQESVRQIERLCGVDEPTTIVMHQTGLEPAIVGFYRAVAERLATDPHGLVVLPQFFQRNGPFLPGKAWRVQ